MHIKPGWFVAEIESVISDTSCELNGVSRGESRTVSRDREVVL